ncbi:MAG: right-handed parallel beta-helix repeat-containing protein, partial [Clostridia bacterium]|nr:right-handed parallel beta-helix repeat-containing protein [Clostridia bacterium]
TKADGTVEETAAPSDKLLIELGVKLEAYQLTYENDSFGNKYDANILECDILATPETIDEILATASEGTVIGLAAGKYGSITLTQNNLTLITNTAVVDYVNANAKENCKLIGITFDAAGAQKGYDPKNGQLSFYTSVASGENVSSGADYLEIIDCTFTGTPVDASNYCVISFYDRQRVSGATEGFTVEDCTFETDAAYYIYAYYPGYNVKGTIEIIDNTFGTANTSVDTAVYLGSIKAHAVVRNNTFVNSGVVVTPHNNASCTYALNVEVSYNHFINTSDADTTAIALRNFYGLPKCTTTVKDNTANYGKSVIKDPYIDTQFYECYDVTTAPADFKMASNAAELTSAIESATEDITIMLMSDITATVTAKQNADVDVVIDGQGYECSETIYLHGQARHTGAETLTIKNINFVSDTAIDFISANSTGSTERYAHNVTVENCTFKGTGTGDVVGLRLRQTYNITIKNCTADGMHSLLWATGGDGITVDNVTVTNSKHGVSFGTTKNAAVKNCNFTSTDAYGYGIRADASGAYSLTVENSTIKAAAPILLRKATGTYAATLSGNTLTATGAYQIIVTAGDFEEGKDLTAPTGVCTLTGADGLTVYKG